MDLLFETSVDLQETWIKSSIERIKDQFLVMKEKFPFQWELKTYWEADQAGLLVYEKPEALPSKFGEALLSGDRNFYYEGQLVFHTRHIVAMQFIPFEKLQHLYLCQEIFGTEGALKVELECDELIPIQRFCSEMNGVIHRESIDLKNKGLVDIYSKMNSEIEKHECDSRLKKRLSYLKDLVTRYKNNPILYRPELERMKLI